MNLNVNLNLKVDTLPELLATIAALREAGIQPTVTTSGDTVRATRPIMRGKHPLELKYNEVTGKQFRLTKGHCAAKMPDGTTLWEDGATGRKELSEIPPLLRLSAIAGGLMATGKVTEEEMQELLRADYAPDTDTGEDELPPGIAPLETVEGEAGEDEGEGGALF